MLLFQKSSPRSRPLLSVRAWKPFLSGRLPGQVVIQYTDRCNAACAQCGMRVANRFARSTMEKDAARRLLDHLAARGVQAISFTGGEPLLHLDDILDLAAHARDAGIPFIRTGTNGFLFRHHEAPDFLDRMDRLAARLAGSAFNTFWISLDSADPAVHEANRGLPGVVSGLALALPRFHAQGFHPAVNLGVNRATGGLGEAYLAPGLPEGEFQDRARRAFARFYQQALDLGFTMTNACYPMSLPEDQAGDAVYTATSAEEMIRFTRAEKVLLFKALYETIPAFRHALRIFSPRCSLLSLIRQYESGETTAYPCRGGIDFFFVDAREMRAYPCGYRGEDSLGPASSLDPASLAASPDCTRCDWECFRDPSELLGPVAEAARHPVRLARRLNDDREMTRAWWEDLRYYRDCGFFDARKAPDAGRLARWRRPE